MAGLRMRYTLFALAGLALTGCAPSVPDSAASVVDAGRGVGFQNYSDYAAAREQALTNGTPLPATLPGPTSVQASALGADAQAAAANSGITPLQASPRNPAPAVVTNAAGISGENDFDAVSGQRDIEADAALIARNRAQYTVIQPTALPTRADTGAPNIVEYALSTNNPVGTPLFERSRFRAEVKQQRACAQFASADLAQEAFLAAGGPEKDRAGMDPDGDGFACGWNPAPFRAVRGG